MNLENIYIKGENNINQENFYLIFNSKFYYILMLEKVIYKNKTNK